MTERRSRTEKEIPLYLIPRAIASRIRAWGDVICRISIVRTHWHHYNVTVRTKRVHRELAPVSSAVFEEVPGSAGMRDIDRKRRGCTA